MDNWNPRAGGKRNAGKIKMRKQWPKFDKKKNKLKSYNLTNPKQYKPQIGRGKQYVSLTGISSSQMGNVMY